MNLPSQHPSPPTPFIANIDALNRASEALAQPGHAVALVGPAGSGKTSLAAMLAKQLADSVEGEPLWIDCEGRRGRRPNIAELASAVLEHLGDEFSSLPRSEIVETMRDRLRNRRMLVVLDGIEDEGQIRDLIPAADWDYSLIVSSREDLSRVEIPRVDLGPLPRGEGINLLRETACHPAELEDEALSAALVEAANGLPLAIRMIGSQIASGVSAEGLLHSVRSESARLSLVASDSDSGSLQSALVTTYEALSAKGEELFRLIGLLTSDSFTAAELEREFNLPQSLIGKLEELVALGLLGTDGKSYYMHTLIRRFAREQLGRQGIDSETARIARPHLEDPLFKQLNREEGQSESPNSLDDYVAAQEYALRVATEAGEQTSVVQALGNLGTLYANRGQLDDARGTFLAALSTADAMGNLNLGAQLNLALGRVEQEQDRLQSAEARIRNSLAMFETSGDLEGQRVALIHLGDLLVAGKQFEAAEAAYDRALVAGDDPEATASILGRKALLASYGDDPSGSRPLFEAALKAMGSEGRESERAAMLRQLGVVLMREGEMVDAAEQLQEAFHLFRDVGNAHGTAMVALAISSMLLIAEDADRARTWLMKAVGSVEQLQDPQLTAIAAFASSLVAEAQGHWDQVRPLQEEAMSGFRKMEDRVGEARSLLALGALLKRSEELEEAAAVTSLGEKLLLEEGEDKLSPQEALLQMVLN